MVSREEEKGKVLEIGGKDEMYGCRNGRLQDLVRVCYSKGN